MCESGLRTKTIVMLDIKSCLKAAFFVIKTQFVKIYASESPFSLASLT